MKKSEAIWRLKCLKFGHLTGFRDSGRSWRLEQIPLVVGQVGRIRFSSPFAHGFLLDGNLGKTAITKPKASAISISK